MSTDIQGVVYPCNRAGDGVVLDKITNGGRGIKFSRRRTLRFRENRPREFVATFSHLLLFSSSSNTKKQRKTLALYIFVEESLFINCIVRTRTRTPFNTIKCDERRFAFLPSRLRRTTPFRFHHPTRQATLYTRRWLTRSWGFRARDPVFQRAFRCRSNDVTGFWSIERSVFADLNTARETAGSRQGWRRRRTVELKTRSSVGSR